MKNKTILWVLVVMLAMAGNIKAQQRQIHIVSANDMHATINNMPMLAAIVDSLRGIDNNLLVLSAGDNRTGNPINDLYSIPTYPMTALMNFIGFDASAFGNHEFDNKQPGLSQVMATSNFPYLCANFKADPELNVNPLPYIIFYVDGISVGIIGVVQLGTHGYPDSHPNFMKGFHFSPVEQTIENYKWLREKVDVLILLSHIGYEDDVVMASKFPWIDVIIGGHTHTQLKGGEMHNGVLVTQNVNKLKRVTYTTITLDGKKIIDKRAENIEVAAYPKKNEVAQNLVNFFNDNPEFKRQLAVVNSEFTCREELGVMMCDAIISETGADVAIQNHGGVRYDTKEVGPFTVDDVLRLDPFGNECIEMMLTGEELRQMLISCYNNDDHDFPYVSGVKCEVTVDKDKKEIKNLKLFSPDGKKLNLKKKYKVAANSYVAAICDAPREDQGTSTGVVCSNMLMRFLEKKGTIDYNGVKNLKYME